MKHTEHSRRIYRILKPLIDAPAESPLRTKALILAAESMAPGDQELQVLRAQDMIAAYCHQTKKGA